jgi:hypothetical protein
MEARLAALPGLKRAKETVRRFIASESPVHAVLLYGAEGAGKTALAREITRYWLGAGNERYQKAVDAFDRDNAADVLTLVPVGPSSILKLAQITEVDPPDKDYNGTPLRTFFRTLPIVAKNRVVVMHDAHRMNDAARNSLLKPLEEPTEQGKILLMTTSISSITPTIRSRCLSIACDLPSPEEAENPFDDDRWGKMAGYAPAILNRFAGNKEVYGSVIAFADQLLSARPAHALALAERFKDVAKGLEDSEKLNARAANALAIQLLAQLLYGDARTPADWLAKLIRAHRMVLGNVNPGIVFDALFSGLVLSRSRAR